MNNLEELRQILAGEPSPLAFRALCSLLAVWQGVDADVARAEAAEALKKWPDSARQAPWTWCRALMQGAKSPYWEWVRSVQLYSNHIGAESIKLAELGGIDKTVSWLEVLAFFYDDTAAKTLAADPSRWAGLKHLPSPNVLNSVYINTDEDAQTFLQSPLLPQLETLALHISSFGKLSAALPPFQPVLTHLQALTLNCQVKHDVSGLLDAAKLPVLKKLELIPDWYGSWDVNTSSDAIRRLVEAPVLAQLNYLRMTEFPEDAVLTVCARTDLNLDVLHLHNRHYKENLVPEQLFARRLTLSGIQQLEKSSIFKSLTEFSIHSEHLGDEVLRLLAQTTPSRLTRLELCDLDLTDDGLARLGQMPQLEAVIHLDLTRNHNLTEKGIAALFKSPYLKNLRHLKLGSSLYNPYYGGGDIQSSGFGDAGAAALAASGILSQLDTLTLKYAKIGADGAKALAKAAANTHLKTLDISQNPIGAEGLIALAESPLFNTVRELNLSLCDLDDTPLSALANAHMPHLRVLELEYNSITAAGAAVLANAEVLSGLWRLSLHDNFIGDDGLIALANSPYLTRLIELDVEQDVWNYHNVRFRDSAAEALAQSKTFARLDAFWGGLVDEYHGERYQHPFSASGMAQVTTSPQLRAEMRYGLKMDAASEDHEPPPEEKPQLPSFYTPEKIEKMRRDYDFRTRTPYPESDE